MEQVEDEKSFKRKSHKVQSLEYVYDFSYCIKYLSTVMYYRSTVPYDGLAVFDIVYYILSEYVLHTMY